MSVKLDPNNVEDQLKKMIPGAFGQNRMLTNRHGLHQTEKVQEILHQTDESFENDNEYPEMYPFNDQSGMIENKNPNINIKRKSIGWMESEDIFPTKKLAKYY